jgi:phosphoenolpyruvate synthase/pyruvate phosphate dikinase
VLLPPPRQSLLDYSEEPLVWDASFRQDMLRRIAEIGIAVENTLGSPQDIEGVVAKGEFFVVQSRAQVGLDHV